MTFLAHAEDEGTPHAEAAEVETSAGAVEIEAEPSGIAALGINGEMFAAQLLHFVIVLLIFWKWVYKPIVAMLDRRAETIEKSLKDAKELETRVQALEGERASVIAQAKGEALSILDGARADAEERKKEMLKKTKAEVERLVKAGKAEFAKEKTAMIAEAKQEIITLAIESARAVLKDGVSEKSSQKLAAETVEKITSV